MKSKFLTRFFFAAQVTAAAQQRTTTIRIACKSRAKTACKKAGRNCQQDAGKGPKKGQKTTAGKKPAATLLPTGVNAAPLALTTRVHDKKTKPNWRPVKNKWRNTRHS